MDGPSFGIMAPSLPKTHFADGNIGIDGPRYLVLDGENAAESAIAVP
jgi:hypothetical protein